MTAARHVYAGVMSGTSVDGVDVAILGLGNGQCTSIGHASLPYEPSLRASLLELARLEQIPVGSLGEIQYELSEFYSVCVLEALNLAKIPSSMVRAICCHGQTIRHLPDQGFSWQLLDAALLATRCEIDVVSQFRQKDLALGGQGAPLVPFFHAYLVESIHNRPTAFLNLGGIANLSILTSGSDMLGFDVGPANTLMDRLCGLAGLGNFDPGGSLAAKGKPDPQLLALMQSDPYFSQYPPKSTGPERFNLNWLQRCVDQLEGNLPVADIMASLAELTATTIADALQNHAAPGQVIVFGGGLRNAHLMGRLEALAPRYYFQSSACIGIEPEYMEATAFAWLGHQFMEKIPLDLPPVTRARRSALLGTFTPWR